MVIPPSCSSPLAACPRSSRSHVPGRSWCTEIPLMPKSPQLESALRHEGSGKHSKWWTERRHGWGMVSWLATWGWDVQAWAVFLSHAMTKQEWGRNGSWCRTRCGQRRRKTAGPGWSVCDSKAPGLGGRTPSSGRSPGQSCGALNHCASSSSSRVRPSTQSI